mgnify:CR=1 FL=1
MRCSGSYGRCFGSAGLAWRACAWLHSHRACAQAVNTQRDAPKRVEALPVETHAAGRAVLSVQHAAMFVRQLLAQLQPPGGPGDEHRAAVQGFAGVHALRHGRAAQREQQQRRGVLQRILAAVLEGEYGVEWDA